MADHTKIEWADATANYVNGCSVVSPGCTNYYRLGKKRNGDLLDGAQHQAGPV
jgi:protein gp37